MREFAIKAILIILVLAGMFGVAFLTLTLGPNMPLGNLALLGLGQMLLAGAGIWVAITRVFE